ncbi:MAG: DUF262 domain-containing protein [Chitinophagaceae bacterium]|nr:MAG: DUF262 domain-containing protein [Chitinophagaceae bacterium]
MALQQEINEKKKKIHTDGYPMSIGELISLYRDGELDIHPEFQRFFRWSPQQKSKLIESILLGIPIPSIFVSQREDGVWDVVDGLQRLSTIFEFVGVLSDEKGNAVAPSVLTKTAYLPSLAGKMWESHDANNSFDTTLRLAFKREKIDVKIVKKESDGTVKFELFQRLNTLGTQLSDQEVRNCLLVMLDSGFYDWLKQLSEYPSFLNTVSLAERLLDEKYNMELALRFVLLNLINLDEVRGVQDFSEFITDKMVEYVRSGNFSAPLLARQFTATFDFLDWALPEMAFKKFNVEKQRFEGKFLVAAFEAVGIGLSRNIDAWIRLPKDDALRQHFVSRVQDLWRDASFQAKYGSGVNVTTRVPVIIPLGEKILVP